MEDRVKRDRYLWLVVINGILLSIILLVFIVSASQVFGWNWYWTGMLDKSLWDWLALLFVPAILTLGVFMLNQGQAKRENKEAKRKDKKEIQRYYVDSVLNIQLDIRNARVFLRAHNDFEAYTQQSEGLIRVFYTLVSVCDGLKGTLGIFAQQGYILTELEAVSKYLEGCDEEFESFYRHVEKAMKKQKRTLKSQKGTLRDVIASINVANRGMEWMIDFIDGGRKYEENTRKISDVRHIMLEEWNKYY